MIETTNWAGRAAYKAYAMGHVSGIVDRSGQPGLAHLISINRHGARLKRLGQNPGMPFREGDPLRLNVRLERQGLETGYIPCFVEWVDGAELGVTFHADLALGAAELQAMLRV